MPRIFELQFNSIRNLNLLIVADGFKKLHRGFNIHFTVQGQVFVSSGLFFHQLVTVFEHELGNFLSGSSGENLTAKTLSGKFWNPTNMIKVGMANNQKINRFWIKGKRGIIALFRQSISLEKTAIKKNFAV